MPTNFENIEINDANGVARKVAGDFETQGPDTIFHQTARNLNTVLEEVTGVTLFGSTSGPVDIALNGMESHVLVDINGILDVPLFVQLQFTTGGKFYQADYDQLQPLRTVSGRRDPNSDGGINDGEMSPGVETLASQAGSEVFLIPTFGAITCRLLLYGTTTSIAGTAWKRIVRTPELIKTKTKILHNVIGATTYSECAQPSYAEGEFLGDSDSFNIGGLGTTNETNVIPILDDITIKPNSTEFGDVDVIIAATNFTSLDGDPFVATVSQRGAIYQILEFRKIPGVGQYKLSSLGPANGYMGRAAGLGIKLASWTSGQAELGRVIFVAREPVTTGISFGVESSMTISLD